MRRPGTLPVTNNASGHRGGGGGGGNSGGGGGGGGGGGSGTGGGVRGVVDDGTVSLSAASIDGVTSNSARSHYSSHSLRRTPHSQPQLSAREPDDRIRTLESGLQNGIPAGGRHQSSPPPLPSRHQPNCGQSSYPTLPVNGHAAHHYHHHTREREKDRPSARERNRERDGGPPPPPPPPPVTSHRSDKHRETQLEMELRDNLDMGVIGTYRA